MLNVFNDDSGNFSTMRVIVVLVVVAVLANWIILNLKAPDGTTINLDWQEIIMVTSAVLGKAGQKFAEK